MAAVVAGCVFACAAGAATSVRCDLTPATALGNALAAANPGTVLAITGICTQQVTASSVLQGGIVLTNHTGNPQQPLDTSDGIAGQIQIAGPIQVTINGISLQGAASDQGYPSLVAVQGSTVTIVNAQLVDSWRDGLVVDSKGNATVLATAISGNGAAGIAGETDGIRIEQGSALTLGALDDDGAITTADAVTVTNNAGNGIAAFGASAITDAGSTIQSNGASQLLIADGSAAKLIGTQVTQTAASTQPGNFTIQAMQSSRVTLMQGASVAGGTVAGGVLAISSSSLMTVSSAIANDMALPALEASGGSNVLLSGGNTVTNSATGAVVEIDHSSSLMQIAVAPLSAEFAGVPATAASAVDTVTGAGLIQEQSSIDLGIGLVGGLAGLVWNGSITVAQNSSFRLSGGVSISGSVTLTQGSNGFFNVTKGGTNTVTAGVSCPWTAVPSSHVTSGGLSPPAPIATDLQTATKTQ
jgi:hypothetical protein